MGTVITKGRKIRCFVRPDNTRCDRKVRGTCFLCNKGRRAVDSWYGRQTPRDYKQHRRSPSYHHQQATDNAPRQLRTYISVKSPLDSKLCLLVLPTMPQTASGGLIGRAQKVPERLPLTLITRIHRMTHAPASQAILICTDASCNTPALEEDTNLVTRECVACQKS